MSKFNKKTETSTNTPTRKVSPVIVITENQNLSKNLNNASTTTTAEAAATKATVTKSQEKRKSSLKNKDGNKQTTDSGNKFFIGASSDDSSSDYSDDVELVDKETQTEESNLADALKELNIKETKVRELPILVDLLNSEDGLKQLTDEELLALVEKREIPSYKLESILGDPERGVKIRRMYISNEVNALDAIFRIPYTRYDYSLVMGACCENVIGYMPIPLGTAGPLLLDGKKYQVPMATTEGCLVASTNRGCRALFLSNGVRSSIFGDSMTRGPGIFKFSNFF